MRGGRGFGGFGGQLIKKVSQDQKALLEAEEWIAELKRFDFDRIHSTTNLRILTFMQPSEELSFPPTRTIWLLSKKMEISLFMSHHISYHLTSFGKQVLLEKDMVPTDSLLKKMEISSSMTIKIQFSGLQIPMEREMLLTPCCLLTKEISNGMELWVNFNGNLNPPDIDLLSQQNIAKISFIIHGLVHKLDYLCINIFLKNFE
jgi:hypothetical protein